MTVIWILRFLPYDGGTAIDLVYRTHQAAVAAEAAVTAAPRLTLTDDYGIRVTIDAGRCATILTSTAASAAIHADLAAASRAPSLGSLSFPAQSS